MHNTYKTIVRNHAKGTDGLLTRIIGKNSALTIPAKRGRASDCGSPSRTASFKAVHISESSAVVCRFTMFVDIQTFFFLTFLSA